MSGTSTPSLASSSSSSVSGSISRPIPRPAMIGLTREVLRTMMSDMKLRSSDVQSYLSAFQDCASTTPTDQSIALPTFKCRSMRPESKANVNAMLLDVSDLHDRAENGDLTRTETLLLSLAVRKVSECSNLQQAIEVATSATSEVDDGSEA